MSVDIPSESVDEDPQTFLETGAAAWGQDGASRLTHTPQAASVTSRDAPKVELEPSEACEAI